MLSARARISDVSPMPRRAIIVGSGPNGLTAAILLARAGLDVTVFEANDTIGGGVRSAELTLPGFTHDVCSAIHPDRISIARVVPRGAAGREETSTV